MYFHKQNKNNGDTFSALTNLQTNIFFGLKLFCYENNLTAHSQKYLEMIPNYVNAFALTYTSDPLHNLPDLHTALQDTTE